MQINLDKVKTMQGLAAVIAIFMSPFSHHVFCFLPVYCKLKPPNKSARAEFGLLGTSDLGLRRVHSKVYPPCSLLLSLSFCR
jgi:hypothetical protein